MNKKVRTKIPKVSKVRSELQKEINSVCPFCGNSEVGHFVIHHIDENPSNNSAQNLILLCPICHSKITKGDIKVDEVLEKKEKLASLILNSNKFELNDLTIKNIGPKLQKEIEPNIYIYDNDKYAILCSSTEFFEGRICDTFPGLRGLRVFDDPIECVKRLERFLKPPVFFNYASEFAFQDPIWWFRGKDGDLQIMKYSKLSASKCLINIIEYDIKRIAVYHSSSRFKNFIYVEVNPEKPTGINSYTTNEYIKHLIMENRFPTEEFALYDGKFIKREEFDDGSAEINGEVIDISGKAELRQRYLGPYNFIIAAKASSFNSDYDYKISEYLNNLLNDKIDFNEFINMVEELPRTIFKME